MIWLSYQFCWIYLDRSTFNGIKRCYSKQKISLEMKYYSTQMFFINPECYSIIHCDITVISVVLIIFWSVNIQQKKTLFIWNEILFKWNISALTLFIFLARLSVALMNLSRLNARSVCDDFTWFNVCDAYFTVIS